MNNFSKYIVSLEDFTNYLNDYPLKINILLGNGYSISLESNFKYENLFEMIKDKLESRNINHLLDESMKSNLENILSNYLIFINILNIYKLECKTEELNDDINLFKEALIDVINEIHPNDHNSVSYNENINEKILKQCKNVFTTNYDLFLYWYDLNNDKNNNKLDDGFRKKHSYPSMTFHDFVEERRLFFLHGALHLFKNEDGSIQKLKSGRSLSDVTTNINNNHFPLIVFEGNSNSKMKKINSNVYLKECFVQFNNLTGMLIIYGHSLNETDKHLIDVIINLIKNKSISCIVLFYYNELTSKQIDFIKKILAFELGSSLELYLINSNIEGEV